MSKPTDVCAVCAGPRVGVCATASRTSGRACQWAIPAEARTSALASLAACLESASAALEVLDTACAPERYELAAAMTRLREIEERVKRKRPRLNVPALIIGSSVP